jgi:type IV secretion system protein VirB5
MKIRRVVLASVAALAIIGTGAEPAAAQFGGQFVIDLRAIAQAKLQLTQLQQQFAQLQQTYAAIAHLPQNELNKLAQQLNVQQFRNPLNMPSVNVGAIMNGSGIGSGSVGTAAQGYLNQNRVYSPGGQDFRAQQMNRNANSIAGVQAMASQLYESAATHLTALQGLEGQLAGAKDSKEVGDIQARIGMEQAAFQAQSVQAQSLAMWQQAAERSENQQRDEVRRQQIDNLIAQAQQHGG